MGTLEVEFVEGLDGETKVVRTARLNSFLEAIGNLLKIDIVLSNISAN
jgi:hypothetical protein